ncbi:sialidase-3-like [Asterias amurensis]|uniref:sialidase-3-like n=1 Tax=Asterias amurensis TaxID=7602 RepID=UPI003AB79AB3
MRLHRLTHCILLGLSFGTIILLYMFLTTHLGITTFLPMLKNAPIHSGVKMLQARWNDISGFRIDHCVSDQLRNASRLTEGSSYVVNSQHSQDLAESLNLNLQTAWTSPSPSLFSKEAFENTEFPQFKARIPALIHYKNTFLVFCEARFDGVEDWGNMMLSMRRGLQKGREVTWERIRLLASISGFRTMNPSPVVDRQSGAIVLVFSAFPTHMNFQDMLMYAGHPLSRVYVMKSYDVGFTWTDPIDITGSTIGKMDPFPVLYVPGPGHSVQMKCGRLVVPGNMFTLDRTGKGIINICSNCTNLSNVIYSDDGGTTWHLGAETSSSEDSSGFPIHPNEVQVAELEDGTLYMNSRTLNPLHPRAHCYSFDGGRTLSAIQLDMTLIEPGFKRRNGAWVPSSTGGCAGSVISFGIGHHKVLTPHRNWLVFSNPVDSVERVNLGMRLSVDGGLSWSKPWILFPHKSGYSDLVYFETHYGGKLEHNFAVLFEGGSLNFFDHIKFQMFNLQALLKNIYEQKEKESS